MKLHWENLHDWWEEDIYFDLFQIWELKLIKRKHSYDEIGDVLLGIIKDVKKHKNILVKQYEKIYGDKPDIQQMRRDVEGNVWKLTEWLKSNHPKGTTT